MVTQENQVVAKLTEAAQLIVKTTGYLLIACVLYVFIFSCMYVVSSVLLTRGIVLSYGLLREFQKDFYHNRGYRNIWQMQRDCIAFDERLIYIPKIGECKFHNPEFDTTLHFEETGRHRNRTPLLKSEIGIVVLGDSFAMGWGVNDHESFANILQDELQRPVYNLAVASYGTVRELLRFQQSGLRDKIDTILIQYSANDLGENTNIDNENAFLEAKTHYQEVFNGAKPIGDESVLKSINRAFSFAIEKPVRHFRELLLSTKQKEQFAPHYQELITVLKKFPKLLENKRVVVFCTDKDRLVGFHVGKDSSVGNVEFLDLELDTNDYYIIDEHLNSLGHKKVSKALSRYLEKSYMGESVR